MTIFFGITTRRLYTCPEVVIFTFMPVIIPCPAYFYYSDYNGARSLPFKRLNGCGEISWCPKFNDLLRE
jgi:hypothetical protein